MTDITPTKHRRKRILLVTMYVAMFLYGIVQVMLPESGGAYYLFAVLLAGTAAWWVATDARDRGKPILHVVQLLIFVSWPIAVPIYLLSSRRFRGAGWAVANAVGLAVALCLGFYGTILCVYGPEALAG